MELYVENSNHIYARLWCFQLSQMSLKVTLKIVIGRFSRRACKHIRCLMSLTTYQILLVEFGELPMESYNLKIPMSFQQQLAHVPSSRLVSQAVLFSCHLAQQRANI